MLDVVINADSYPVFKGTEKEVLNWFGENYDLKDGGPIYGFGDDDYWIQVDGSGREIHLSSYLNPMEREAARRR